TISAPAIAEADPSSFAAVLERISAESDEAMAAQTAIDPPALEPATAFEMVTEPEPEIEMVTEPEPEIEDEPAPDPLAAFAALALDVRTHPRDVVVIGPRSNVEAVETERLAWRRRLDPTVVVVDAPVSMADDHYWARDVIAALEPHIVWGVVDGGRKLEDLAAWSEIVGGVDALAVNGVQDTMTPASVLHLGLPVALVDGEPASPELWADIL